MIEVGKIVKPKTPAGLQITDVPCNGDYYQKRNVVGVFIGYGTVVEVNDIVIDYDTWPDSKDHGLGKVEYRNCKIITNDGLVGWAGEVALV